MSLQVSVIIPSFGRGEWLGRTCRSVLSQLPADGELIVVEQNDPPSGIEGQFVGEKRIRWFCARPASLPGARNFGAARARGEVLLFLDDDVTLDAGCIEAHLAAHERSPAPLAVVGRVHVAGAEPADSLPLPQFDATGILEGSFNSTRSGCCTTVIGCNMSFRREALRDVGGFDTSFRGSAVREEADFVARLRAGRSGVVWFEATASLDHHVAPVGGCRDGRALENPTHYRNLSIFAFRTLSPVLWGAYWLSLYRSCVWWSKDTASVFKARNRAFASGVASGFLRAWWPERFELVRIGGGAAS
jgi:GT2 family glycosyltransferase